MFNELQLKNGADRALVIPLHGNTRWGSAYGMLNRAYELRAVCAFLYYAFTTANLCLFVTVHQSVHRQRRRHIRANHKGPTQGHASQEHPMECIRFNEQRLGACTPVCQYSCSKYYFRVRPRGVLT